MPTVRYTNIEGQIVAENRSGTRRTYVPDVLGSTIAAVNPAQAVSDAFEYSGYGTEVSQAGTTSIGFRFVGTFGYRRDTSSRSYVRARQLQSSSGRWLTRDPLSEHVNDYWYADGDPVSMRDTTGRKAVAVAAKAKDKSGSFGAGRCPGKDSLSFAEKTLKSRPNCKRAFEINCRGSIADTISPKKGKPIPFVIGECSPGQSSCVRADITTGNVGGCKPINICFTGALCKADAKTRGTALLFELVNWCFCARLGSPQGEAAAESILHLCGLKHVGRGGGVRHR